MKLIVKQLSMSQLAVDLLVLPVTKENLKTTKKTKPRGGKVSFDTVNSQFDGGLVKSLKRLGFEATHGSTSLFKNPSADRCPMLLVVGWDDNYLNLFNMVEKFRKLGALITNQANSIGVTKAALVTDNLELDDDCLIALREGLELAGYRYDRYKTKKDKKATFTELTLLTGKKVSTKGQRFAQKVADGTMLARDLINTPALDCNPAALVKTCRAIGKKGDLKVQVYDKARLEKMGANLILAVNKGSDLPPYLIKMTYKPQRKNPKVVALVGKGITFDSGGLCIKPATGMYDMKVDMSGAAAVIGAMQAIAALKPNVEVRAYVPATENMINGKAIRPGDVVKALSGKTVEILNTDAEGRLILADALSLATKEGADAIVDLATLTGACVIALGDEYAGMFSTNPELSEELSEAAELEGELLWELPLAEEYKAHIKSEIADVKHIGKREGGAISAALFLKEFVGDSNWVHLDIAGPSNTKSPRDYISHGGVGFGVRTLVRYVVENS